MTKDDHKLRHQELHEAFDELIADFIDNTQRMPSQATLLELIEWSYKQTKEPDHDASSSIQ